MSDNEILDQLSTFLFAGSDTTAISIAWALYYLSLNPTIQTELRDELIQLVAPLRLLLRDGVVQFRFARKSLDGEAEAHGAEENDAHAVDKGLPPQPGD